MKACVLDVPKSVRERPLEYRDVATPAVGPGEVLIRVRFCGVCRTDLHVVEGELASAKSPVIPGHQVVGVVQELGNAVHDVTVGQRVGVAWLYKTCGTCRDCLAGRENLCRSALYTGWNRDGGYAEYIVAAADYVYPLPEAIGDAEAAPLLCAGIIGFRCLSQCRVDRWPGTKLGLYGFGAAGHIAIQVARARGAEVYVCTRDRRKHAALAEELGAVWVGGPLDPPPAKLDAAIVFAPAGEIVPAALDALDRGGRLVLGGIHMSPIPEIAYDRLYWERSICTVANNTRSDGRAFLDEAARIGVRTHTECFPLSAANDALIALKHGAIRGAALLDCA